MRRFTSIVVLALSAACGGEDPPTDADSLPCEVQAVLQSRCQQCHAAEPRFGAPMPLVSRADLLAPALAGGSVVEASLARMVAPSRMPPPPNAPATAEEVTILADWLEAGAPGRPSGQTCGPVATPSGSLPLDCEADVSLVPAVPFEMPATSMDEQVCFGIDLPAPDAKRHITAIAPRIDNSRIIHHILLLRAPTPVSPEPTPCAFTSIDWQLLYAWGPGTPPHVVPDQAGFPLEPDEPAHFVLQIHYNNLQGLEGETDQSGIDLCTTDQLRPHDAGVMAFGAIGFDEIPALSTARLDCSTPVPEALGPALPLTIFQSWPHMHTLGRSFSSGVLSSGGTVSPLAVVPDYDFDYQLAYPNDVSLQAGDTVLTSCTWENSTTSGVRFGEGTADEMCFNFVSYFPRIDSPSWNWLAPAAVSQCEMAPP